MVQATKVINEKLATVLVIGVGAITCAAFMYWMYALFI